MKKTKIFIVLTLIIALVMAFACAASAEEAIQENPVIEADSDDGIYTLYDRLYQFYEANKTEIHAGIGDISILAFAVFSAFKNAKKGKSLDLSITTVKEETKASVDNQENLIIAFNKMIEEFNEMMRGYEKMRDLFNDFELSEEERKAAITNIESITRAILEMIDTVYVNSKNLPQGVKNLVTLTYSDCLTSIRHTKVEEDLEGENN